MFLFFLFRRKSKKYNPAYAGGKASFADPQCLQLKSTMKDSFPRDPFSDRIYRITRIFDIIFSGFQMKPEKHQSASGGKGLESLKYLLCRIIDLQGVSTPVVLFSSAILPAFGRGQTILRFRQETAKKSVLSCLSCLNSPFSFNWRRTRS